MPWWLDREPPPSRIRALWIRATRFLYRGPRAWVVWLNLGISCITLVPLVQLFVVWLFTKHQVLSGDTNVLVGGFAYLFLAASSEIPYGVCAIIVLLTCWLLLVREIPLKVRCVTAAIEVGACAQLVWMLHSLKAAFQYGPFGKP